MLTISKEEFLEIYHGLPICDSIDLFYSKPASNEEFYNKYIRSKLWRLNNLYTIVNKHGQVIRFRMNKSQHKVYAASLRHPRLVILKSRQQGISTFWLVSFFDDSITRKHFSIGLMAQGQDEAATLLERTKLLWEQLHPSVKKFFKVGISKDNMKEFSLTNRSNIFIRTSFRSTTLQRLHISEMGKIANKYPEKAQETKTGTLQAIAQGNIAVIESTAEGDNLFKEIWDNAVLYSSSLTPKDFMPIFLSWLDDPDCNVERDQEPNSKQLKYFEEIEQSLGIKITRTQRNFWVTQYRELGDKIYQEYPSTPTEAFMATKQGSYYAHLYMEYVKKYKREVTGLYDKNLAVQVAIDLGMNDTNSIVVFQTYKNEFRIIDEFYDSGQDIKYYTDWMRKRSWFDNLEHLILPHDAEVRELTSGKTRTEVFESELQEDSRGRDLGLEITILPKTEDINEDIEKVRQVIRELWIEQSCSYLMKCIVNYKKEYDDKRDKWRDKPYHDEHSNGADSIRYMVVGAHRGTKIKFGKSTVNIDQVREARRNSKSNGGFDV